MYPNAWALSLIFQKHRLQYIRIIPDTLWYISDLITDMYTPYGSAMEEFYLFIVYVIDQKIYEAILCGKSLNLLY